MFLHVILEMTARGWGGGGKETEVEKGRVVAHLVFISFPCFLIFQAKGPFQLEAMTLLLWYFIAEDRPQPAQHAHVLGASAALLWVGRLGGVRAAVLLVLVQWEDF